MAMKVYDFHFRLSLRHSAPLKQSTASAVRRTAASRLQRLGGMPLRSRVTAIRPGARFRQSTCMPFALITAMALGSLRNATKSAAALDCFPATGAAPTNTV
jgi:hypothetical protein